MNAQSENVAFDAGKFNIDLMRYGMWIGDANEADDQAEGRRRTEAVLKWLERHQTAVPAESHRMVDSGIAIVKSKLSQMPPAKGMYNLPQLPTAEGIYSDFNVIRKQGMQSVKDIKSVLPICPRDLAGNVSYCFAASNGLRFQDQPVDWDHLFASFLRGYMHALHVNDPTSFEQSIDCLRRWAGMTPLNAGHSQEEVIRRVDEIIGFSSNSDDGPLVPPTPPPPNAPLWVTLVRGIGALGRGALEVQRIVAKSQPAIRQVTDVFEKMETTHFL